MKHTKRFHRMLCTLSIILLCCPLLTAQVVRPRNPNAPVGQPTTPTNPPPGSDKGIIIVGGKGNKPVEATEPIEGMETRDAGPKITPNPNPVYIPKGQTQTQANIGWDVGPGLWYCEIFMAVNGGEESELGRGHDGAKPVTIELGSNYDFKMVVYSGENGEDPRTVTTLNIKGRLQPENRPPAGSSASGVVVRPGTKGDLTNYIAYIQDVAAAPNANSVAITLWTSGGVTPTVEIGNVAPVQAGGRWAFPTGQSVGQGAALASQRTGPLSKKVGTSANTLYKFDSAVANISALEPGTTYYFIVSAQNPSGIHAQTTGSFTTSSQTVRVVFDAIKILNDSDEDEPIGLFNGGEIDLWFWVNYGHPSAKGLALWNLNDNRAFTDNIYDLKKEFVLENAPHSLTLSVSGREDDLFVGKKADGPGVPLPLNDPEYHYNNHATNVAKGEWNLSGLPGASGATYRKEFTLTSMVGGDLKFEVYGYWEVTPH